MASDSAGPRGKPESDSPAPKHGDPTRHVNPRHDGLWGRDKCQAPYELAMRWILAGLRVATGKGGRHREW
jgi:hypothetical protein